MTSETRIDVTALEKVTARLEEALDAYQGTPDNLFILDSVIKRFELTYIQSIRVIERFLLDHAPIAPENDASFREVIEAATEFGLTQASWEEWLEFRKARNKTAHTYMEEIQRGLVDQARRFLPVARFVLENVKRRTSENE